MPLIHIDLAVGYTPAQRRLVGDAVHESLVEAFGIPDGDRFQTITEHAAGDLIADPAFLGVDRSAALIFVRVTLLPKPVEQKEAFYAAVVARLHTAVGQRPEDVVISLTEVAREDFSFGNGVAYHRARPA